MVRESNNTTVGNGHDTIRKTAIVTGGASGLGSFMAQHFAHEGYNVAIFDVNAEMGNDLAGKITQLCQPSFKTRAIFKTCDVSSWADQANNFKEVYREFGRIDVVCANAGISEGGASAMALIEEDSEPMEPKLKIMDVNLTGVIYCMSHAPKTKLKWTKKLTDFCQPT